MWLTWSEKLVGGSGEDGVTTAWILITASSLASGRSQISLCCHLLESLLPVTNHSPRVSAKSIIIPVTSNSLLLPTVCPPLTQYTIHSVDMLKRDHSDKINPCIYLYDNIKLDLLKLYLVLI